jgi:DNA-binding protein H-NS
MEIGATGASDPVAISEIAARQLGVAPCGSTEVLVPKQARSSDKPAVPRFGRWGYSDQCVVATVAARYADGASMENSDLKSMAIDELWELHKQIVAKLTRELARERARLEERLHKLGSATKVITSERQRRAYPKVLPKYRNPKNPAETWSGRGKQPRWLTAQLRSGKKVNDFVIRPRARREYENHPA